MKRKKYPIHGDFKKWAKIVPPHNKSALYFLQGVARSLYNKEKTTRELKVERLNIPVGKDKNGKSLFIRALMYSPVGVKKDAPCLVFYHGGGFVLPSSPHHYRLAKRYAIGAKCKVLFVEYRLAPKYTFPVPRDDCYAAYEWLLKNAKKLSVDPDRIAVCGDSAGGALAAVVSIMARDKNEKLPCGQMLIYPVTGIGTDTPSMRKYDDTPMCNSKLVDRYTALFFGKTSASEHEYAAPLGTKNLAGLPETYLETAEFDCLRDEGILYGKKLKDAGVGVEFCDTAGTIHAFDIVKKSAIVDECVRKRTAFLGRVFAR